MGNLKLIHASHLSFISDSRQNLRQIIENKPELPVTCGDKEGILYVEKYNHSKYRHLKNLVMSLLLKTNIILKVQNIDALVHKAFQLNKLYINFCFQWRCASSVRASGSSQMSLRYLEEKKGAKSGGTASFTMALHSRNSLRCIRTASLLTVSTNAHISSVMISIQ